MGILASLQAFLLFLAYLLTSLLMLALFARLYLWITPYNDLKDIHDGKVAPAISLSGALIGFTCPLLMASYLQSNFWSFLVWSAIACGIQLAVFFAMYRYLPRVIEGNNTAGAICYAVVAVCAGLINAASFIP
jgi:putative membrane protein